MQRLVSCESQDTARGANNNVGGIIAFEQLNVDVDWLATVDDFTADLLGELCEAIQLVFYLVSQLSRVAEDDGAARLGVVAEVLKDCQQEHRCLAHA